MFNQKDLREIYAVVTQSAKTLASLSRPEIKLLLQKKLLEKRGYNELADLKTFAHINDKTVRKYLGIMLVTERQGKSKPVSRVEPYANIRNAISKAAGFTSLIKMCPVEMWHTEDEVGFFIFGWHTTKPKLCSTVDADAWLRTNNVSLSTSEDPDQQRCAHIGTTQQPSRGGLTCFYLRIVDSKFPETKSRNQPDVHKPVIMLLNAKTNCYLVLCHPSVTDTTVSEYIGKCITCPAIFAKQDEVIKREIMEAACGDDAGMVYASQSQPAEPAALDEGTYFMTSVFILLFSNYIAMHI